MSFDYDLEELSEINLYKMGYHLTRKDIPQIIVNIKIDWLIDIVF